MKVMAVDHLEERQKADIWSLLKAVDREFIPPLSSRNSTSQSQLNPGESEGEEEPWAYYEMMVEQEFVLTIEEDKVVGFLTYIPDREVCYPIKNKTVIADYISTIAVSPDYRNRGITRQMYRTFLENSHAKVIATRTWSLNHAHIHILESMGFELAETIIDDRGEGIDTVYYQKIR